MTYPKISIVTTSFNQGQYLEETILSVLEQSYPNLEYIIIDGGSTDNSIEIIKKYEKRLAYWVSEKDSGMYDAIQKGFDKSTGEIMAWINSDDWYHKRSFFVIAEVFSRFAEVEWLQGLPSLIDDEGRIVSVNDFRRWTKYDFLQGKYQFIQQESCFWRRKLWESAGGRLNTELKYAGDFALWLRFFDFAELYCLKTVIGVFRARSKNQFSVDRMFEYTEEANKLLKMRQENLMKGERKNLRKFLLYQKLISKIPLINALYYYRHINPLYPSVIHFDRMSQMFIKGKRQSRGFYDIAKAYIKSKF